jgi:hypothetical protein
MFGTGKEKSNVGLRSGSDGWLTTCKASDVVQDGSVRVRNSEYLGLYWFQDRVKNVLFMVTSSSECSACQHVSVGSNVS